jgi:hypothetical protein
MTDKTTITLDRKDLIALRDHYADKEAEGKTYTEQARNMPDGTPEERERKRVMFEMYLYQQGKTAGFKEGIEELFFKADGAFPHFEREASRAKESESKSADGR